MKRFPIAPSVVAAVLALTAGNATAKGFVTEAASVVDQVVEQSQAATDEIEAFYRDYHAPASRMVDLEARVERWKTEGYLCERYVDCVEKYDLIYAYYDQSVAEIQQAFQRRQDGILAAISHFNRIVYQGKDRLLDLRSNELTELPAKVQQLRNTQERLKARNLELRQECPERTSRECKRRWREFERDLNRSDREIKRVAYISKVAKLRESILARLQEVLERYTDMEEQWVDLLTRHAYVLEEAGTYSGAAGIGGMIANLRNLKGFSQTVEQMVKLLDGMEHHVRQVASVTNDRVSLIADGDIDVESRRDRLIESGDMLDAHEDILQGLEQDVGLTG